MQNKINQLAKYEIEWWKAHHRKDEESLLRNMAKLYELQFGISYEDSLKAIRYRVLATKEHDLAEKFEDSKNTPEAEIHWKKAEKLLRQHFKILYSFKKNA